MKFLSLVSDAKSSTAAMMNLIAQARESEIKPDAAFVFFTAHHAASAPKLIDKLRKELQLPILIGCSAEGVIGGEVEIEREPGIALLVAQVPGVRIHPFHIPRDDWRELLSDPNILRRRFGFENDTRAIIGFGDPFTTP